MEKKHETQDRKNDVIATERLRLALQMRRLGHTYEEIAESCGYANASGAWKAIKKAESSVIRDEGRALVNRQLSYIDYALSTCVMPQVKAGDLFAVDRMVALLKRQADLLGLDAPKEVPLIQQTVIREYPVGVAEAV